MRRRAPVSLVVLCLGLSACGGSRGETRTHPGTSSHPAPRITTVDVYSSLPERGPLSGEAKAVESGIQLALWDARDQAGILRIRYRRLDDATTSGWSQQRTLANAMTAATDPKAVYYIGELDSAASGISIPILNQAGIAEVSPTSSYIGLTQRIPEVPQATRSQPKEPDSYYPAGPQSRNFLRIIPADTVQAAAGVQALKALACTSIAIADDGTVDGTSLAWLLHGSAPLYGIAAVTPPTKIDPTQTDFRTFAEQLRLARANCLAFAGVVSAGAINLAREIRVLVPSIRTILGTDGVCSSAWTKGEPSVYCTRPTPPISTYPEGSVFQMIYRFHYHANPDPFAILGYEAMQVGLDTIGDLGANGANRSAVRQALFAIRERPSMLGTYSFTDTGDTTRTCYGLYRMSIGGDPVFSRVMSPTRVVGLGQIASGSCQTSSS